MLLVDDHALVRRGLRQLLEESGVDVVGEAADGRAAVPLALGLRPQVVLMDLNMPGASGLDATRELAERAPWIRIVILTISASAGDVLAAIAAGACGYLLKTTPLAELVGAVRGAADGQAIISPSIAALLVSRIREQERWQAIPATALDELSARELDVLRLLAEGRENAEIAAALYITPHTVKHHISSILTKLGLKNRVEAAVFAVRSGILARG